MMNYYDIYLQKSFFIVKIMIELFASDFTRQAGTCNYSTVCK